MKMVGPVIDAAAVDPAALAQLGGKARSLHQLGHIDDVRVPPWFALAADVFAAAVGAAGIREALGRALGKLAGEPAGREAIASCRAEIEPLLERLEIPKHAAVAIGDAYDALGGGYVSVRSSALDEDGVERSFAGCLDTSLYVVGITEVHDAILRCWRSAFSERSLAYRATHDALDGDIRVAVIVQLMVTGATSGVLFTADPGTGARDRAIVTSTWGAGEGVVSGRLACDTFVVGRDSGVVDRDIADKSHEIVARPDGCGTREVAVAADRRAASTLDDLQLQQLAALGWEIEGAYGGPVDVEWTWGQDGPWILQARPITTGVSVTGGARKRLWDNSNIIESYDGVTTPLTYSFARRAYAIVYRQAFELLGTPVRDLDANADNFEQMIGLLNGRVYYNLETWYAVIRFLPAYKLNAGFMEQMMGVSERAQFGHERPVVSAAQRWLVEMPRVGVAAARMIGRFARAERLIAQFFADFGDAYGELADQDLDALGFDGLAVLYRQAEDRIMRRWQAPIVNDILAMIYFGLLRKLLATWVSKDDGLANELLCGEGGLESTEPTRDLLRLMVDVRRDAALCVLLRAEPPDEIARRVGADPAFGWLHVRLDAHVARYGDRCVDELKLEEPTLRDDRTFLFAALKGYLSAPPVTVDEMEAREAGIRRAAEAVVSRVLRRRPARAAVLDRVLAGARRHVKNRENLRFARTRAFGLVRRIALAMGRRLVEAGKLDGVDDVFYLELNELLGFARGTATTTDLRGLVEVRKREYAGYLGAEAPPERFWTDGPVYLTSVLSRVSRGASGGVSASEAGDVLEGVPASPGRVRAPARLIREPRTAELRGEVLVANRTDPGWVPLFPSAAAVVVERGSVLSHSAIVAREFGIPCVVGVRDALARLTDGAMVEVDGNAGTVTVVGD